MVLLLYRMRRVDCTSCGVRVEELPWAIGKHQLTKAQGDMQNGTNYLNGLDYSDSRDAFLIRGASGIAVETDFAAGSGPARQARARL
jgi:hypothetical protein